MCIYIYIYIVDHEIVYNNCKVFSNGGIVQPYLTSAITDVSRLFTSAFIMLGSITMQ